MLAIKNVGRIFAKSVISKRVSGDYRSLDDFVSRLADSDLNKRTVESLIKCGTFDSLGVSRRALLECYESILDSEHDRTRNNVQGQMDMFSTAYQSESSKVGYVYPDKPEFPIKELLLMEKESSGMYFSGHLIDDYSRHISDLNPDKISEIIEDISSESLKKYSDKSQVKIAGVISSKRTKVTKRGDVMAYLTIEDRFSEIEVIVFSKHYQKFSEILEEDSAVVIGGNISVEDDEAPRILLSEALPLSSNSDYLGKKTENSGQTIYIKVQTLSDSRINNVKRMAMLNCGNTKLVLYDESTKKYSALKGLLIEPSDRVLARLYSIFGEKNVILK